VTTPEGGPVFTALVLAASRGPEDPVAKSEGVSHKALVDIHGSTMLQRVINALAASEAVGRISVTIDDPSILSALDGPEVHATPLAETPGASVLAGAASLEDPYPLLVTTGDHALLTPEMVDRFCADTLATGADVAAGLASAEVILRDQPETQRTFLKFRDGRFSGCNLFAILNPRGLNAPEFWSQIEHNRKKPWRLVSSFGISALVLFALRRLTLDQAFTRAGQRFDAQAAPILLPWSNAAIDVDRPADLELVRKILGRDG